MALRTGVQLICLIGATVPLPAPPSLTSAIEQVEVTHSDQGRSGFQIVLRANRGQRSNQADYPLLSGALLKPLSRVVLVLRIGVALKVLLDGVVTLRQLVPTGRPGEGLLTITGEDLSVMLDQHEKIVEHPAQTEAMIAAKIITSPAYARYGLTPLIVPPPSSAPPLPTERVPVQHGTDLAYLREMAGRFAYDFYMLPGPMPGVTIAYWGPPRRSGRTQPALCATMGAATNLESISFREDALAPALVHGHTMDVQTNKLVPLQTSRSTRQPLSQHPALRSEANVRTTLPQDMAGLTAAAARARAQAETDRSTDRAVVAEGALDITRYGDILEAHRLVAVRGVGLTFDGAYYVSRVTSEIVPKQNSFRQRFVLAREGVGAKSLNLPI